MPADAMKLGVLLLSTLLLGLACRIVTRDWRPHRTAGDEGSRCADQGLPVLIT